jgi:hypothetical protein
VSKAIPNVDAHPTPPIPQTPHKQPTQTPLLTQSHQLHGNSNVSTCTTRVESYSNASYTLVRSYHVVAGFHLKHPEFDPLGFVNLESTLEASI